MPTQTASNVMAAIKKEAAGTPGVAAASGGGATQLRIVDSPGLRLERGVISSNERRGDLLTNMGRLGGKSVGGSYNAELTVGGATDLLIGAILRNDWSPSLAIAPADMATATVTIAVAGDTSTITASAGNWINNGLRVGDIITFTGLNANNSNRRLRVVSLTATVITVAGAVLTAQSAVAGWALTRLKKINTPANPIRQSWTIEQYDEDIDLSELFLGCRLTGLSLAFRPNSIATVTYTFAGMDRTALTVAQTPWFTSPSLTTGIPLVADDSSIRHNGVDVTKFTGLDLNFAISASGQPVIGSFVTPDIYDNVLTISGQITGVREDFARLLMFDQETEFELSALFTEPGTAPLSCLGVFLPRVKFSGLDAPFLGGEGAKVETLPFMVAPRAAASGYDATAVNFFSSAA